MSPSTTHDDTPIDCRRRALVLGAAGTALGQMAGCGGGAGAAELGAVNASALTDPNAGLNSEPALPLIPLDPGVADGAGGRLFTLVAQRGSTQMLGGVTTNTLGYNGAVLGPALRLRTRQNTRIRVQNDLGEVTTVHWHGLVVPAGVDGGPHQAIQPGATWDASFTVSNPAATCWYHPHFHGSTGRQVVSGLAGFLIVEDPAIGPSVLPDTWGIDDLALVLQDKRFTASGQIDYTLSPSELITGYSGDRLLVNGVVGPVWQAPRQWVRLRLLNGCNARTLALRLGNSTPMLQIANEAGVLATPVTRSSLTLAPGERAEVLVDFSSAASAQQTLLYASAVNAGMGMGGGTNTSEVTALTMRVTVLRQPGAMVSPPAALPAAPAVAAGAGATIRSFTLDGGFMGHPFTLNGRSFDMNRIDLAIPASTVEVWRFINATGMAHPMHVHGVQMSLLSRGGSTPAAYEQGLRDTFVVESMQTVSVAVQTASAASSVPLMVHCHILEHEDAGMMAQFITV